MNLKINLVKDSINILEAMKKFKEVPETLTLFVVNKYNKMVGTLTDGDVRRGFLSGFSLEDNVDKFMFTNFYSLNKHFTLSDLKEAKRNGIRLLPFLDDKQKVVKVYDLKKLKSILPLECMIMAGGRGKRLSPLTDTVPKPMLPLGDKPIIEHNIDRLISYGIEKIYISVKYLGEQIQDYFGDGSKKGISIEYIWEKEFLGTAGALALVDEFKSDHVLLMNSDLFTNVDFEYLYLELIKNKADMAVASTDYKIDVPFAVFETKNEQVLNFKEKPTYIYHSNAGIYILNKNLIAKIPKNEFYDITDLMDDLVKDGGKLVHSPIIGYWIDIGKSFDYNKAQEFVKHIK